MGHEPPATIETDCSNCTAEAGDYQNPRVTTHFVDIATDAELGDDRYTEHWRRPQPIEISGGV